MDNMVNTCGNAAIDAMPKMQRHIEGLLINNQSIN